MRIRRLVLVALLALLVAPFGLLPRGHAAAALQVPYAAASESHYRVETDTGRMSVRIHIEFQNMQQRELSALPIYLMPGAENIVVKAGDQALETKVTAGDEAAGRAGVVLATLPTPLKNNLRTILDASYEIPARTGGKLMTLEAGLVETPFIGQGPGSFVLVDVPKKGDNYFDPGCLKASDQPKDIVADGLERWVCGEVLVIAFNGDDPDVLKRCAAMDDKCRQRIDIGVFSAYVQSVTDFSRVGKLEGDVAMPDGRTVHLALKYFKRDQSWADKQWAIAQKAFPMLEALFGFPYPGEAVVMRQSHHLEIVGAAGLALDGEVLLVTDSGFDEEVTIHELAHMWAGYNLDTKWLWEGLAEYGTRAVAPELGVTPIDRGWSKMPFKDPLALWGNGSSVFFPDYWYGKSGAFFFAYEEAIGGRAAMTDVLRRMDDEPGLLPLSAGWFMDQGEWVSRKNLDALFSEWVFNPSTSKAVLAERRVAHDKVWAMRDRATALGLDGMPSEIYDNLLAWVFAPIDGQVAAANKVLDSYGQVLQMSADAGLGAPEGVSKSWGKQRTSETAVIVEEQRQAIAAILSAAKQLEAESPDSVPARKLAEAREKYANGDYAGAKTAAADGLTAAFNQGAAGKMIAIAKQKQESFSAGFFGRIGLLFTDPEGDLAEAEKAHADGDGTTALKLSRSAYDAWNQAPERGMQRLAIAGGVMFGLTLLVWYALRRLDGSSPRPKRLGQGHYLEETAERRSSWRDWENTP